MKYIVMPFAVWRFFCASFEKNLTAVFGTTKAETQSTMAKAKGKYKEIIYSGNIALVCFSDKKDDRVFIGACKTSCAVV